MIHTVDIKKMSDDTRTITHFGLSSTHTPDPEKWMTKTAANRKPMQKQLPKKKKKKKAKETSNRNVELIHSAPSGSRAH